MAKATGKDHAQINLDIWGDDDWLDLTPRAQHLYFVLWTSPELSYCGCGPWHPGKIAAKAKGWSATDVETAAVELSAELFLIVDTDTEEFDLRSWIKHDGLWKRPNLAVSMANARAALASRTLRGVVVHEVAKIKARNIAEASPENPVSTSWQKDAVKSLLGQRPIDPASLPRFTPTLTAPLTPGLTPTLTPSVTPGLNISRGVGVDPTADPTPTPSPAPSPFSSSIGGYVSRERHLAPVPDSSDPPSPRCADHQDAPAGKGCGGCADARRARDDWDIAQAAARAEAIVACPDCDDENGFVLVDGATDTWKRCTHPKLREAANA